MLSRTSDVVCDALRDERRRHVRWGLSRGRRSLYGDGWNMRVRAGTAPYLRRLVSSVQWRVSGGQYLREPHGCTDMPVRAGVFNKRGLR